ncbi:hypothetical protein ACGF3G_01605 [Streptomyces sp. NPDC048179]|uniref:hypothetical protein n=1 Tax=Streptomyces sp. NPDC048179 TaxID=3365506 RepID=UPI00371C22DF
MDMQKEAQRRPQTRQARPPEGRLVVAIRIPVRISVFLVVLPVRLLWDACTAAARFLGRYVLVPVARFLWRHVLAPTGRAIGWILHRLLVLPLIWLYRHLLTPLGHALLWLHARVLTPIGRALLWLLTPVATAVARVFDRLATALAWTARVLLVLPARALWRWILTPVGRVLGIVLRETGDALGHAWRAAGYVARAAGRVLATLFRWIFQEPARWVYRTVLTPVGHVVRDLVLRPAAQAARAVGHAVGQARADLRRALFGEPVPPTAVHRREPVGRDARTLDG